MWLIRRRARSRAAAIVAVAALSLTSLIACSNNESGGSAGGSTVSIAVAGDPRSLFASTVPVQAEITVSEQITEKLIEFNPAGDGFEPRLATEWSLASPGVLRLNLRPDVKFTNGEPFNAQSAVFSGGVTAQSKGFASYTANLKKFTAVDDHTLDVEFAGSEQSALALLAFTSFQYPPEYFGKKGQEEFGTSPIGTGPFTLAKWTKGVSVELDANPDYWNGKPKIDHLKFVVFSDGAAALAALQSGSIQLVTNPQIGSLDALRSSSGAKLMTVPGSRLYVLQFSKYSKTPITNPKVGLAIQHAIDVDSLIKNNLAGEATSAKGQYVVSNAAGWDESMSQPTYDPDLARKLLAEAGYPNGFSLKFVYTSGYYPQDKEIGQEIAASLENVGITVTQEALESGTFLTRLGPPPTINDIFLRGVLAPPLANYYLQNYKSNYQNPYYSNPDFDKVFGKASTASSDSEWTDDMHQAAKILAEDPPGVPLYVGNDLYGVSTSLQGFVPRNQQFIDARSFSLS